MAIKDALAPRTSRQRRLIFGGNVLAMILVAFVLLVLVNWIGQRRHFRRDVSTLASFGLSERSKRIIDNAPEPIRLTSIYTSREPGKERDKYLPRLKDLFEEYALYSDKVETENIANDDEKLELIRRIQAKYAGASEKHQAVIEDAKKLYEELEQTLQREADGFTQLIGAGGWLAHFPSFANIRANFLHDRKELQKVVEDVTDLLTRGGLPRYSEANTKIKNANNQVKKDLEDSQQWLTEMGKLVEALTGTPETAFVRETNAKLAKLAELEDELIRAVGKPNEPVPDDPKPAITKFAEAARKAALFLRGESARLKKFADDHPAIGEHPRWRFQSRTSGMIALVTTIELPDVLAMVEEDLSQRRDEVRAILRQEKELYRLKTVLERLRQIVQMRTGDLDKARKALAAIFEDIRSIDASSKDLLKRVETEKPYQGFIDRLAELNKRIDELPKLDLSEIARKLEEPNVVVVETVKKQEDGSETGKVQVVDFEDVWPQADRWRGFRTDEDEIERVFNGDAAIAAAVLSLTCEKPFATVVITYFEPEPDERMRQMGMRPPTGSIPSNRLTALRRRLEKANFTVKNWNLATQDDPPKPAEGTQNVYLFLPPATEPQRTPWGPRPQTKRFGDKELQKVRKVLADGGRGIFLANWEAPPMGMFGPMGPAQYGYDTMLRDTWGVDVRFTIRVIRAIPDPRNPDKFMLGPERWNWMRLNNFTDHPIGKPLKARRVMMTDVCPVEPVDKPPQGVRVEPLLVVPAAPEYWGDRSPTQTIRELRQTQRATKSPDDLRPPFPVAVAAVKDNGPDKKPSKIVVLGNGISLVDGYLDQKVPRFGTKGQITFDPPPSANADLLVNALYWLVDREDLIAAGPEVLPQIGLIERSDRVKLWTVTIAWALLALAGGGVVLFTRRK